MEDIIMFFKDLSLFCSSSLFPSRWRMDWLTLLYRELSLEIVLYSSLKRFSRSASLCISLNVLLYSCVSLECEIYTALPDAV